MLTKHASCNYTIVDTAEKLKKIVPDLKQAEMLAVDLEADSMYHFRERVCLIQMAIPGINLVIDPLSIDDLSPLGPLFSGRKIQKIFHGADYDIRSLYRDYGFEVNNLFDTELACRFLGCHETSLEAVLKDRFDVHLDKRFQRKDWSKRPLPEEMVEYAARDAIHLISLAKELQTELRQKGRYDWVIEECEYLSRVRPPDLAHDPLFLRCKGAGRLDRRSLAVLEALLRLRLQLAEKKNRPVFKIISTRSLLSLAQAKPSTLRRLSGLEALSEKQIQMYGEAILAAVQKGVSLPGDKLPIYPRKKAPVLAPAIPGRIRSIKAWRDRLAEELRIDPTMLLNKAMMTAIAVKCPETLKGFGEIKGVRKWQKREFGKAVVRLIKQTR